MNKKVALSLVITVSVLVILGTIVIGNLASEGVREEIPNDPFGKKPVLGLLLRLPVLRHALSAEISLQEFQEYQIADIVNEEESQFRNLRQARLPAEEHNIQTELILKSTNKKLKQVLSPIQYVRFRDWIVEQWILERNSRKLRRNLPSVGPIMPTTVHWIGFMRTQIKLSRHDIQTIENLIFQAKQDALSLRNSLVELAIDPTIPIPTLEEEGNTIIEKIRNRINRQDSDLMKELPLNKRKLYTSYMSIPTQSRSDTKRGN